MKKLILLIFALLSLISIVSGVDLSFRSVATASGNGASIACTAPAGIVEDDLLVTVISTACLGSCTPPTVTTLSGHTLIGTQISPGLAGGAYTSRMTSFYRVAGGSEPGTYTWSLSGASFTSGITCTDYDNPDTSSPFDTSSFGTFTGTTTPTSNSITTANDNAMIVTSYLSGCSGSSCTWTPPSGETERADHSNTNFNDEIQASSGASGGKTATSTSSGNGIHSIYSFNSEVVASGTRECEYGGSGDMVCNCTDHDDINTSVDLGGNSLIIRGVGTGEIQLSISLTDVDEIIIDEGFCELAIISGGDIG